MFRDGKSGRELPNSLPLLILDPCVDGDPVRFPSLNAVIGERLLESIGVRRDLGEHAADQDGAPIEFLLVVELPSSVLELTDRGCAQGAAGAVREIEAPLTRLRIVE